MKKKRKFEDPGNISFYRFHRQRYISKKKNVRRGREEGKNPLGKFLIRIYNMKCKKQKDLCYLITFAQKATDEHRHNESVFIFSFIFLNERKFI